MPLPTDLYRVQFVFELGGGADVANTGFTARYSSGSFQEDANAVAEHAYSAWIAGFGDDQARYPNSVKLVTTKAYHVMPGPGHSDAIGEYISGSDGTPIWTGGGTDSLPWEVTPCVTLEAQPDGARVANPRRYRGRMYLPPIATNWVGGPSGFLAGGIKAIILTEVHTMLEYFNDTIGGTGPQARAVVMSRTGGFATDIRAVSMDDQLDLQKRRQNRQAGGTRTRHADLDA